MTRTTDVTSRSVFPCSWHRRWHALKEEVLGWEEITSIWICWNNSWSPLYQAERLRAKKPCLLCSMPWAPVYTGLHMTAASLQQRSWDISSRHGGVCKTGFPLLLLSSVTWSSNPLSQYLTRKAKAEVFLDPGQVTWDTDCSPTWNLLTPEQQHKEGSRCSLLSPALWIKCKEAIAASGLARNL